MNRPPILTTGHTLPRPALEWTDGHILGNGDLGAVVWGSAEQLRFGLSKHNVYNLEALRPNGVRMEHTYLEMLAIFREKGPEAVELNPDLPPETPSDKSAFDRQTPLTLGTLTLEVLSGVNIRSFSQTLLPAEGLVRLELQPVDRRKSYGQKYPAVTVEAHIDSEQNALRLRVLSGEGEPVRVRWRYDWPQHVASHYKTRFEAQSARQGLFHADIGEDNGFTVLLTQRSLAPDLDASRFGLSGIVSAAENEPAELCLRAFTRDEPCPEETVYDLSRSRTAAWWQDFWSRSMLFYGDPRLNDLWAMGLYALGASTRPDKSAPNLQGIWNLSERAIWHSDFHFNTNIQECHWACGPSNHPELAKALFRMLLHDWRDTLRAHARELYGVDNAAAVGVGMDWKGRNLGGWWSMLSLSSTAWTAITLWDQYLFAPDETFLKDEFFPFLQECCRLYDALLVMEDDGLYHTPLSLSPERTAWDDQGRRYSLMGRDCTINVAVIRALYEAAAQAARTLGEDDSRYAFVAARMPPFPQRDGVLIEMETGYFRDGPRPGVTKECHRHPSRLMPVFPAGFIGLNSDKDTLDFGIRSFKDFFADGEASMTGWSYAYLANIAARLGLGDEAERLLTVFLTEFTLPGLLSAHNRLTHEIYDDSLFQIEALMAVPAALTEMALQSTDGVIRVFPAIPDRRDCAFERLRARGGVLVSAERTDGKTRFVRFEADRADSVTLVSPWGGAPVTVNGAETRPENGLLTVCVEPGCAVTVLPA